MAGAPCGASSEGAAGPSSQGCADGAGPGPGTVLWMLADATPGQTAAITSTAVTAPSAGSGSRAARRWERGYRCAGVPPAGRLLPRSTRVTLLAAPRAYPI